MDFTYNGTSSTAYGLICRSKNRSLLPQVRQSYEYVFGRNGTYDFSDGTLEDRVIEIECDFVETSVANLRSEARGIAAWLKGANGRSELYFSDEPNIRYSARVTNAIDLEQMATVGSFSVVFRCDPLGYASSNTTTTLTYTNLQVPATASLSSSGTAPALPTINVTASATIASSTVTITPSGQTALTITGVPLGTSALVIDCDKKQVYTSGTPNVNRLALVSGDFPKLSAGSNTWTLNATGLTTGQSVTFQVIHKARHY